MPKIISVSSIDLPYRVPQAELKNFAEEVFSGAFTGISKLLDSFDNAQIDHRNFCVPVDFFYSEKSFKEKNDLYIEKTLEYSVKAIKECLLRSGISKEQVTDIIFVSTTGISTPSPDALIINAMRLDPSISRLPVWGLGCAGGTAGISKSNVIAKANPDAVVIVTAIELCSLTFIRKDLSKSNFIATGLFSDGAAAVLVCGDNVQTVSGPEIIASKSRIYYDSLDVMGWDIVNDGFRVVFSKDIPSIVNRSVKQEIESFLAENDLELNDIKNFIVHPGGVKVIEAYINALNIHPDKFSTTRKILREYGNMSSATVLYVLDEFLKNGMQKGNSLMMSLGPGFSSEMVLIRETLDARG